MTEITCPSGLSGRIRGMKVREERILTDRKLAKDGGQVDALLAACWQDTLDAGPYDFADGTVDWAKVLQGDRFYALLQVRMATYGPEYAFEVTCQNEACRAKIEWELDLNDLPVRALTPESLAAFSSGNRFETILPDAGVRIGFRLLTGAEERKIPALRRGVRDRMISAMLSLRVTDIEGVDVRSKRTFIEDLTMRDATFLIDAFQQVDCGVETAIEIECPDCMTVQEVELPFDQTFFIPGPKSPKAKRERTTSSAA